MNSGQAAALELQGVNDDQVQAPGGWKKFYPYALTFPAVAQNAQQPFNLQIQDDAAFYWQAAVYEVIDTTTFLAVDPANVDIQLTDRGSNFPIFENGVPIKTVGSSDAALPFVLPVCYRFQRLSTINGLIINNSAIAHPLLVTYVLHGFKLFVPEQIS